MTCIISLDDSHVLCFSIVGFKASSSKKHPGADECGRDDKGECGIALTKV